MPQENDKIKALTRFLDPEDKKKSMKITYNATIDVYETEDGKRFYVLTPAEMRSKYREVAVKAWDQGITRFLEGSHVFPEEYVTDYSYFVDEARKAGVALKTTENPLHWWIKQWIEKNSAQGAVQDYAKEGEEEAAENGEGFKQTDLDEINFGGVEKGEEETPQEESADSVLDSYKNSMELKKALHRLFRSGNVGFDKKGFFDAVVEETDPGLLLGRDNLTHQVNYDGKIYKIFYV